MKTYKRIYIFFFLPNNAIPHFFFLKMKILKIMIFDDVDIVKN